MTMAETSTRMLAAALTYIAIGWHVVPEPLKRVGNCSLDRADSGTMDMLTRQIIRIEISMPLRCQPALFSCFGWRVSSLISMPGKRV